MAYEKELEFACNAARGAMRIILDHYAAADIEVRWKGKNDPVTDADEAATQYFLNILGEHFPLDAILIEEREDDQSRLGNSRAWIIDPLDGTKEFIARNGEFSIMIGLVVDGRPVLGAVAVPVSNLIYGGVVGGGAFVMKNENEKTPIAAARPQDPANVRLIVSRSHRSGKVDKVKQRLGFTNEIPCGSVGLKMIRVISGDADLYVHFGKGAKLWDTCAPEAIARAAGVKFTDLAGADIDYLSSNVMLRQGILVAPEGLHEKVIKAASDLLE